MNLLKKEYLINQFKKKTKDKKGVSTIEFVIALLIFIMLFSFVYDLFLVAYRQYTVTNHATKIVRQLSKQSGISTSIPLNFPGGDKNYITVNELYEMTDKKFKGLSIPTEDWKMYITVKDKNAPTSDKVRTVQILPSSKGLLTDYRDTIEVKISYKYKWSLWSQFVPGDNYGSIEISRHGFSEYKHDYSKWEGED